MGIKRPKRKADHPHSASAEVKNPACLYGTVRSTCVHLGWQF